VIINITDYMLEFQKLKVSIENDDLILVIGKQGTGKSMFVDKCLEKLENISIINIDQNSDIKRVLKQLEVVNMFGNKNIFIYDDNVVKGKFLTSIQKKFSRDDIKKNNKFIVITNDKGGFFNFNFSIHTLRYPKRHEVLRYLKDLKIDDKIIKTILSLPEYNLRRIQYTLEDGYYSGYDKDNNKFNITDNNYILSMVVAENLTNLKRLKEDIIEADKFKYNNDYFYKNYLNTFYKDISKKKLRYPKELLSIKKRGEKTG